jgi:rRNA processing protein Gar1
MIDDNEIMLDNESDDNEIEVVIEEDVNNMVSDMDFISSQIDCNPLPWEINKDDFSNNANIKVDSTNSMSNDNEDNKKDDSVDSDEDDDDNNNNIIIVSSDDSDDSDDETYKQISMKTAEMAWLGTEEEDSDMISGPVRTKNEVEDIVTADDCKDVIIDLKTDELELIGQVMYKIDNEKTIVVQSSYTESPLCEKSVLCKKDGMLLGRIHEVFGPITNPFYIVKWVDSSAVIIKTNVKGNKNKKKSKIPQESINNVDEDEDKDKIIEEITTTDITASDEIVEPEEDSNEVIDVISPTVVSTRALSMLEFAAGVDVYCVRRHSSFVTPKSLLLGQGKGTDASNVYDEEVPEDEQEFSDDEAELASKQAKNKAKRGLKGDLKKSNNDNNNYDILPGARVNNGKYNNKSNYNSKNNNRNNNNNNIHNNNSNNNGSIFQNNYQRVSQYQYNQSMPPPMPYQQLQQTNAYPPTQQYPPQQMQHQYPLQPQLSPGQPQGFLPQGQYQQPSNIYPNQQQLPWQGFNYNNSNSHIPTPPNHYPNNNIPMQTNNQHNIHQQFQYPLNNNFNQQPPHSIVRPPLPPLPKK